MSDRMPLPGHRVTSVGIYATDEPVTVTVPVSVLNDLRTAALERWSEERSAADKSGGKGLRRLAAQSGGRAQVYAHAVQVLDYAMGASHG